MNYKTEVTLTINEFVKEDVGLYTCVSTNSLGLKESDVRVYGKAFLNLILGKASCFSVLNSSRILQIRCDQSVLGITTGIPVRKSTGFSIFAI